MTETSELPLVSLAAQLRDVAIRTDRPDVAAKAEEIILLITRAEHPSGVSKGETIQRILNGLGF